ncbi:AAA family ATPase [Leyella stercorea]|uniref:AAA family ATPase n=2 Tax=Prevotellaceae TaxID=171552 RepID=UPI00243095DB|nr:AAA family ATPase [Leyella stercorea]
MTQKNSMERVDALINEANAATTLSGITVQQEKQSFITVSLFNDCLEKGRGMESPRELIKHVVVEHETTFLFGDTGLGKTILAIQMACEMAEQGKRVLYVNFELSDVQLAMRYPDKKFPGGLFVANVDYSRMHDVTEQSHILDEIQRLALAHDIEVVVIDNFTNLCINSKEGSEAGNIMLQLVSLRMTHNWTMLILAHVPKRRPGDPLTLNDLAGSKILSNLADNVIGLNKSKKHKDMRYLIQLKYRSFSIELDYKNVQELMISTSDDWLHFEYGGYDEERAHLPRSRDEKAELEHDIVKELKEPNGLSYRDIADKLGTSLSMVQRTARNNKLSRKVDKPSKK